MRFHLTMFCMVIAVSLGMHAMASAATPPFAPLATVVAPASPAVPAAPHTGWVAPGVGTRRS